MDNQKVPKPTCDNCLRPCKQDEPCDKHVFAPGVLPFAQTKADAINGRIQYEGCWWNGQGALDYSSHEIFIVCKAREVFGEEGCSETTNNE